MNGSSSRFTATLSRCCVVLSSLLLACSSGEKSPDGSAGSGAVQGGAPAAGGGAPSSSGIAGTLPQGGQTGAAGSGASGAATFAGAAGLANVAGAGAGGVTNAGGNAGAPAVAGTGAIAGASTGGTAGSGGAATGGASPCVATTAVAKMKIGWNLGNSLDSVDAAKSDTEVETAWGNPRVTPALIRAVADAGFGVVRIPVTWIGRFGPAPDYTIRKTYLARVEEVVRYVLDAGLYAIINLHHDGAEGMTGQWISLVNESGQVDAANDARVIAQLEKTWAQIADHFQGYGERLVFESMNEIKVGYGTPLPAYLQQVNALNAAFVRVIRASGGNNPTRCLVVPGYNTNIDHTLAGFVAPPDTSAGKLILSAHYYDPWSYAGAAMTHTWGAGAPGTDNWGQEDWVRTVVGKLKTTYIDKGLPVIWGEYGAVHQTGYEEYNRYYIEYVTKATHDAGIVPIVWDNGSRGSGEEAFGLVDRRSNTILYPKILEAMMRAVTSSYALSDVAKP